MLQKQNINLTFQGVDTKTDDKTLPIGKLVTLQNADITNIPTIEKRHGYAALGSISAQNVFTFNDTLLAISNNQLYSYADSSDQWVLKSVANNYNDTVTPLVGGGVTQSLQDYIESGSTAILAYTDASGSLVFAIKDTTTNSFIFNPTIVTSTTLGASVASLRCVAHGDTYWVFVRAGAKVWAVCGTFSNPTVYTLVAHQTDATTVPIDACSFGAHAVCVYKTTGAIAKVFMVTGNNVIGSPSVGLPATTSLTLNYTLNVAVCPGVTSVGLNTFFIAGANASNIKIQQLDASFVDAETPRTINISTSPYFVNHIGCVYKDNILHIAYDFPTGTTKESSVISLITHTTGAVISDDTVIIKGSLLAQPIFIDDNLFIPWLYDSDEGLQTTAFMQRLVFDDDALAWRVYPAAKMLPNIAQTRQTNHIHSNFGNVFCCGKKVLNTSSGVVNNTVKCTVEHIDIVSALDCLDTFLIAGSILDHYDSVSLVEEGFLLYPEPPTLTSATTGGHMANGTYLYCAVYEWIDANGRIMRSAPSTPVSITLSGGTSTETVKATVQTLWNTSKLSSTAQVAIHLYRTTNGGTVFYKVTSDTTPSYNDLLNYTIDIDDTLADSSITSREILYTEGGAVENIPPPGCTIVARYKDRVVVSGGECGTKLYYSKPITVADSFNFSDVLYEQLNTESVITSVSEMDNNLIVSTKNRILLLNGEFANALGTDSSITKPQILPSDVGSLNSAIVSTPMGIVFKSSKGIWLLDRGLSHSYIGAEVEQYNSEDINSAVLDAKRNKILLTTANRVLVYDYFYKYWSTYSNQCLSSTIQQEQHVILGANGKIYRQSTTNYGDDGIPVNTIIETGWLSLANLQGYQRIYNILFLGEYVGSHRLVVEVYYDFKQFADDIYTIAGSNVVSGTYGSSLTYGSETYGSDEDGVYNFKLKPRIQKCSSVKLKIYDAFPDNNTDGSFKLTSIMFEIGVISNRWKNKAARNLT